MVVLLGVVLIFIGFVFAVARRGMLPGTSSEGDPLGGHSATTDPRTRASDVIFRAIRDCAGRGKPTKEARRNGYRAWSYGSWRSVHRVRALNQPSPRHVHAHTRSVSMATARSPSMGCRSRTPRRCNKWSTPTRPHGPHFPRLSIRSPIPIRPTDGSLATATVGYAMNSDDPGMLSLNVLSVCPKWDAHRKPRLGFDTFRSDRGLAGGLTARGVGLLVISVPDARDVGSGSDRRSTTTGTDRCSARRSIRARSGLQRERCGRRSGTTSGRCSSP